MEVGKYSPSAEFSFPAFLYRTLDFPNEKEKRTMDETFRVEFSAIANGILDQMPAIVL